ncbi:DNA repair protein RadA [Clostridium senegalense]|uniref:DNA repair protein RadA n=1 Tax=Clostridium senegalense TaxID=1465809 RepID=A0A6M0H703_9CLOT|nr:DNA repair protein RadA [Clostridium senegalense]NEU06419.1 DNA repair protein RadA [Clostridium senegalense]
MAKTKNVYVCSQCGYESPKWMGKCLNCNSWNTMTEEVKVPEKAVVFNRAVTISGGGKPQNIKDIKSSQFERFDTGINELNRVIGGGLVKGSLTLISGDPGIGKSTILLQTAKRIADKYGKVLYVSGEESEEQIKMRAERLDCISDNLYILSETSINLIEEHIENMNPVFVIIDSIQTLFKSQITSAPGSVSQVRECTNDLMRIGKTKDIPLFIVAHVTKQGELAGPRVLEHMVDTVLYFEGERTQEFRILRTIKNRFGTTSEIGVFEMRESGLEEILDASSVFLQETSFEQEGSVVIATIEGTRPLLVEIQALVSETKAVMPRRTSVGIDHSRMSLILAVLEKKLKIPFYSSDVYVNVVGGLNLEGTFGDLGLAVALISSAKGRTVKLERPLFVGEVGLTGEVRPISNIERIVNEGQKMGFKNIIMPYKSKEKLGDKFKGVNIIGITTVKEAMGKVF